MWTVESRCSQCGHKAECADRGTIIQDLVALSNAVNTTQANLDSKGDGIIVMVCNDFTPQ